jgi:hypothetical protein
MTVELIITTIILGVLIFIIIYKKTTIKFQFDIDNKNQGSIYESEENHIQKIPEILSKKPSKGPSGKSPERLRKELGKNKWLYTKENFGKMKKGRVL